jgi:hypothetical protein
MTLGKHDSVRDVADRMIRESLKHPENLRAVIEEAVPELAAAFEFSQAELLDRYFPVDDWRCREADLPFRIPYRVGERTAPALVVVLIEHQSDTDTLMPLRMLYFAVTYWDKQWREWAALPSPRSPLRLHPVLPIVLYTGQTEWGSNRTLVDLLGEPAAFHTFAPAWQPLFWDLAGKSPEELLAKANPWLQMLAVLRAEQEDAERFQEIYAEAIRKLLAIASQEKPRWFDLMRILFTWAVWRRPESEYNKLLENTKKGMPSAQAQKEFDEMIANKLGPSMTDLAEARGRAEGQLETWRESLKTLLTTRFESVPASMIEQIEATNDPVRLKDAVRRASKCQTLDEFQL